MNTSQGEMNGQPGNNASSSGILSSYTYTKHTLERSLKPEAMELIRCRHLNIQTTHVKAIELVSFNEAENRLTTKKVIGQELFHTLWNPTNLLGRLQGHRLQNPDTLLSRITEIGTWLRKYHDSSAGLTPEGADGSWLATEFAQKIREIRASNLISERNLKKIEQKYSPELQKLITPDYLFFNNAFPCQIHGNFVLYNVLVDSQQNMHTLGFRKTRVSSNLEDVARFYSTLWAIAQTSRTRHNLFHELPARFLKAYGLPPLIAESAYFQANLVYNFLAHLEAQHRRRKAFSWNTNREMSQITRAGMKWIYQQI
ncbi:hypothetical protein [Marinobacter sp. BSs20148]|jgi:hypothetical protein|uniref:hypothetical protein n=1 Tax=Marinobacter sp. BSs20148 TaxID=490759 RepID=UPI0011807670|nr:hypothetical protein [Marinobacter sp. BSs20148]